MAKVTIEFPSTEMANIFASTFRDGEFANWMNKLSEESEHHERLENFMEDCVKWDESENGNHKIDISMSVE